MKYKPERDICDYCKKKPTWMENIGFMGYIESTICLKCYILRSVPFFIPFVIYILLLFKIV